MIGFIDPSLILILAITLISAAASWLQQRRQAQGEAPESDQKPPLPEAMPRRRMTPSRDPDMGRPAEAHPERASGNWEEALRRLMREAGLRDTTSSAEPRSPHPTPSTPPRLPPSDVVPDAPSPWSAEPYRESDQGVKPPLPGAPVSVANARAAGIPKGAAISSSGNFMTHPTRRRSSGSRVLQRLLHSPQSAREAIMVSVVLAPPKALE